MEIFLIIVAVIFSIIGILASMTPGMPGPVLSYASLILLYFAKPDYAVTPTTLLIFGIAVIIITIVENVLPATIARVKGASKKGMYGSLIGTFVGLLLFPPFGALVGAFLGAIAGELSETFDVNRAVNASIGVMIGTLTALVIRTIFSFWIILFVAERIIVYFMP